MYDESDSLTFRYKMTPVELPINRSFMAGSGNSC